MKREELGDDETIETQNLNDNKEKEWTNELLTRELQVEDNLAAENNESEFVQDSGLHSQSNDFEEQPLVRTAC